MGINFKKLLSITTGCFLALSIFAGREPEIIEDENEDPIGIKLNLPEELIKDCESDFWTLDGKTETELNKFLSSQKNFEAWCEKRKQIDEIASVMSWDVLGQYAYVLAKVNENGYIINGEFCKAVELGRILGSIHLKGAKPCCCCYYTEAEKYIKILKIILLDCF